MKALSLTMILVIGLLLRTNGQGYFEFVLPDGALTHLGSINGPLAGPNIWGQALAGLTQDSLQPVGFSVAHFMGYVVPEEVAVPFGIPSGAGSTVFVQMAAWDGQVWGADFSTVPGSQLGRTDIVLIYLDVPPGPLDQPAWTQSAVVPPVPEPVVLALIALGGAIALSGRFSCRRWR